MYYFFTVYNHVLWQIGRDKILTKLVEVTIWTIQKNKTRCNCCVQFCYTYMLGVLPTELLTLKYLESQLSTKYDELIIFYQRDWISKWNWPVENPIWESWKFLQSWQDFLDSELELQHGINWTL